MVSKSSRVRASAAVSASRRHLCALPLRPYTRRLKAVIHFGVKFLLIFCCTQLRHRRMRKEPTAAGVGLTMQQLLLYLFLENAGACFHAAEPRLRDHGTPFIAKQEVMPVCGDAPAACAASRRQGAEVHIYDVFALPIGRTGPSPS